MKQFSFVFGRRLSALSLSILGATVVLQGCGGGGGDAPAGTSNGSSTGTTSSSGVTTGTGTSGSNSGTSGSTTGSGTGSNTGTNTGTGGSTVVVTPTPPATGGHASEAGIIAETVDTSPAWSQTAGIVVANFDTATDSVANWGYRFGAEFPGALGSLTQTAGVSGLAARLHYDLSCSTASMALLRTNVACGRYVMMASALASPIDMPAANAVLAFDLRNPQGVVNPMIRILDSTGQTLQFSVRGRSLESSTGEQWQRVHLPISKSSNYFGGANDGVLRPPIRSIHLGAGDFAQTQPAGWVDIDNINLLSNPAYSFELKPNAAVAAGSFYPTYVGRLAVSTFIGNPVAHDKALSVGIKIVRRDLTWKAVEVNGQYDFTSYNTAVEALRQKGMSVIFILDYGHPDYGGGPPTTEAARNAFAKFAKAAALNFKGKNVIGFQVWNEPNAALFWPNPDPVAYAQLFNKTAAAIRSVDSTVKIISGGTAGTDINFSMKFAQHTQSELIDIFAVHPYTTPNPELFTNGYTLLQKALASQGINKPIWDTEWGYSSYGDFEASKYGNGHATAARDRQGVLVLRKVLTEMGLNIPFMTIYGLTDYSANPLDRESNFGLLTASNEEKPALLGLRSLYNAQNGRTFRGFLPDVPPGVHVLRWDGGTDKVFVIWSEVVGQKVTIKLPSKATAANRWNGIPATINSGNSVVLEEKDGPMFVTVDR